MGNRVTATDGTDAILSRDGQSKRCCGTRIEANTPVLIQAKWIDVRVVERTSQVTHMFPDAFCQRSGHVDLAGSL